MQFAEYKEFRRSLNSLWKRGGPWQKAADDIYAVLGRLSAGADPLATLSGTRNGESRIKHCFKYHLTKYCRLITVQTDGYCILLYCGDHDDCDRWLERHRGFTPVLEHGKRLEVTFRSDDDTEDGRISGQQGHATGRLYERLPGQLFDGLIAGISWKVAGELAAVESTVTIARLWEIVAPVADADQRLAIHDVFTQLREDREKEAIARARMFTGEAVPLEEVAEEALPEVVDSDVIRRIDPTSKRYGEALRRFMQSARYRDWMLFMHPDQERIVEEDFDGPAKLAGVSGSGKTCVVVQRAVRLARTYTDGRILVLTLNRALAALIDDLVTACAPEEERSRIDVKPFFVLCRELMLDFDPKGDRLYNEVTWKINEHVDEVWQEYYRCETNNHDARVFHEVHDSLLARRWNAERYLREEVDWLRSALKPGDRRRYLDIVRTGRTVTLPRAYRERILEGTSGWEAKMSAVGVVDLLGLAQSVAQYLPRLRPSYRSVLVDEVQDFGNVELEIIRALVPPAENDLFLCGDAAQAVMSKCQSLRTAGITVPGARSRKLALNYRNSRDVLTAAYTVLVHNITEEMLDREDLEILDPEYSAFSAATPLMLEACDLATELRGALALAREKLAAVPDGKCCVAICGYTLYELSRYGESVGLPVLDGTKSIDSGGLFLSDLEQTKGFEFDLVCVVNCSAGILPDGAAPDEERYRDLSRLYVAMTRAKSDLILSWSGRPSLFFSGIEDSFLAAPWAHYVDLDSTDPVVAPSHLEDYRHAGERKHWREMTGEEFLLSEAALGVSTDLSAKLRVLIDGHPLKKGGHSIRWRDLGAAWEAHRRDPRARNLWGPEVGRQFSELVTGLDSLSSPGSRPLASVHDKAIALTMGSEPAARVMPIRHVPGSGPTKDGSV